MKKKKKVIILLLIAVVGVIGFTIAYFSNQVDLDNIFKTKKYKTRLKEEFVSPDNWLPGDTTPKVFSVVNTGEIDEAIRVSYTEEWVAKDGTTILSNWIDENGNSTTPTSNTSPDEKVAVINFGNSRDWTKENGYFYYNYKLAPGEETTALIDSVTFNNKAKANVTCGSANVVNGETIIDCEAANTGYADATYKLTFKVDTVQYESYKDAWNIDLYITPGRLVVKNFVANPVDTEYNEYTKKRMFEIVHPATDQTPALTDYRYVGDDPDNYVYFNCDDENDVSTCEIWRILGVFDVDDGTGNFEQRIKLLRGSLIKDSIVWDENNINDWKQSTIKNFLTGDYYNRTGIASTYGLKESARNMIGDAKYYLGGASCCSGDYTYKYERSNNVFNPLNDSWNCPDGITETGKCAKRDLSWVGKVGLMYPSDYTYTYKENYDNWIYLSQKIDGEEMYHPISWMISPYGYNYQEVAFTQSNSSGFTTYPSQGHYDGSTSCYNGDLPCYYGTRPVVYLNSNIDIVSGGGSSKDPYRLSTTYESLEHQYVSDTEYKSYKFGDEVIYDNSKYYVIKDSNTQENYVTLLKADLLTAEVVNQFGEGYESINGEYPYYQSDSCHYQDNNYNDYNYSECTIDYKKSSIKQMLDNWSEKYKNDLVSINGLKTRLLMMDELCENFGYWRNYYSGTTNRYEYQNGYIPDWLFIEGKLYWTMSSAHYEDGTRKIYIIGNGNVDYDVRDRLYVRPVINLKKCAINGGCTKY